MKVLMTGASGSLGCALLQELQKCDAEIHSISRKKPPESLSKNLTHYSCDLTDRGQIEDLVIPEKNFDGFIHVAGFNITKNLEDFSYEQLLKSFHIYQYAPLILIKHCVESKSRKSVLRAVNISSIWASHGCSKRFMYGMNKAALDSLTRHMASELASKNVLINSVLPGFLDTPLTQVTAKDPYIEDLKSRIPLGGIPKPEAIAPFIIHLISESNKYITGQNFTVDGGLLVAS